jgi:hypothetical protein
MNIIMQVPLRCIIADSDEREELRDLMDCWGFAPWEYPVQHVLGHGITEDKCFVYIDSALE